MLLIIWIPRLGYRRCNYVAAFKEIEFEWLVSDSAKASLLNRSVETLPYNMDDDGKSGS